tara:strand:- start:3013 stop:3591 length:579 start_codon:yes stop_codon:yes gene_type:complete
MITKDYSKGKIYEIVCNIKGLVYYGSTIRTLKKRLSEHKYDYKRGENCSSKFVLQNNNFEIILIEDYPCHSKKELLDREGWYQKNNVCVNKVINGRSRKEYIKQYDIVNKERIKLRKKQYQINNKERLNEYSKQYKINNKEKIIARQKQYYTNNKEHKKQYDKQKYDYEKTWGGNIKSNNNLLNISTDLFTI